MRTTAPPRSAALAACLSLACWHGPTPPPLVPVAVVPFDAYGGAIYVPAVINGFTDLILELWGDEGHHARSAIGASELPFDVPVEVEAVVEVE